MDETSETVTERFIADEGGGFATLSMVDTAEREGAALVLTPERAEAIAAALLAWAKEVPRG